MITGFRPAKHSSLIIGAVQLWNAFDLALHNRLHLEAHNIETLRTIPDNSGLILTANHPDAMDPRILIELSRRNNRRFTYMINAEAFNECHGLYGWLLQRLGDFSVKRGGDDLEARRYAVDVVKNGRDALVMFPEGEVSYLNDLVQPFKAGAVHIGLQAIVENRKTNASWTAYLVPVAIKYRYRKPIGSILDKKISAIEKRLLIRRSVLNFQERIIRIMAKIVSSEALISGIATISEQTTWLDEQIRETQSAILSKIEKKYPQFVADSKANQNAQLIDRAQKIISFLRKKLSRKEMFGPEAKTQIQKDISELKETIQMAGWQPQYIGLAPSDERLAETVMKLEREVFQIKNIHPLGNRDCLVRIGLPLNLSGSVEAYQKNPSPTSHQIAEELRGTIQLMIETMPSY